MSKEHSEFLKAIRKLQEHPIPWDGTAGSYAVFSDQLILALDLLEQKQILFDPKCRVDDINDKVKIKEAVDIAKAVYSVLLKCLPLKLLVSASSLKKFPWTMEEAGIVSAPAPSSGSSEVKLKVVATTTAACAEVPLMDYPHPSRLWKWLQEQMEPDTAQYTRELLHEFHNLKMEPEEDIHSFIARIDSLALRLQKRNNPMSDNDCMNALLCGLVASAHTARTLIESQEDFTYVRACRYLIKHFQTNPNKTAKSEEALLTSASASEAPAMHMASRWTPRGAGEDDRRCYRCRKLGHIRADCPLSARSRSNAQERHMQTSHSKTQAQKGMWCNHCARSSHNTQDCWTKREVEKRNAERAGRSVRPRDQEEEHDEAVVELDADLSELMLQSNEFEVGLCATDDTGRVDTGAQMHVIKDRKYFRELRKPAQPLVLRGFHEGAASVPVTHVGTVRLPLTVAGQNTCVELEAAYVPRARANLISATTLSEEGKYSETIPPTHNKPGCWVCYKGSTRDTGVFMQADLLDKKVLLKIGHCATRGLAPVHPMNESTKVTRQRDVGSTGMSALSLCVAAEEKVEATVSPQDVNVNDNTPHAKADVKKEDLLLMHDRLGHPSAERLTKALQLAGHQVPKDTSILNNCEACKHGKMHRTAIPKHSTRRASRPLERVHSDIVGPMRVESAGGNKYMVSCIDDHSRFAQVYFVTMKSEASGKLMDYLEFWQAHKELLIKIIRSDNGGEYLSKVFIAYCLKHGIKQELTIAGTPQQNGVAERFNRTTMNAARALLSKSQMPHKFWAAAVSHACDINNQLPCKANDGVPPITRWDGSAPQIDDLKVFGCAAYSHRAGGSKLDERAFLCVYIGRDPQRKGYKLYDPNANRFFSSRDVEFNEAYLPYRDNFKVPVPATLAPRLVPAKQQAQLVSQPPLPTVTLPSTTQPSSTAPLALEAAQPQAQEQDQLPPLEQWEVQDGPEVSHQQHELDEARAPAAQPAPAAQLQPAAPVVQAQQVQAVPPRQRERPHRANQGLTPARFVDGLVNDPLQQTDNEEDPRTLQQALNSDDAKEWTEAAQREHKTLIKNGTWVLTELPAGRQAIKCKWTFKRKLNEDGSVERWKARLVAKGFSQRPGVDYDETFAPVPQRKSLNILLALAAQHDWDLHQLDVVSAFLNGSLKEEIYMDQPEGFEDGTNRKCKLVKSIYGLKQASRVWNDSINNALRELGFTRCKTDPCVYVLRKDSKLMILLIHVDDMVIAGKDKDLRKKIVKELSQYYELQDCGPVKWLLGTSVKRDLVKRSLSVSQESAISKLLDQYGMTDCSSAPTPAEAGSQLTAEDSPKDDDEKKEMETVPYKELIGSLLYIANCTRPDIAHSVYQLCRFTSNPGRNHWMAAKRVLRYLRGTKNLALTYTAAKDGDQMTGYAGAAQQIIGYSDASWASDTENRKSTTGYFFQIAGGPVSWCCRQQRSTALSTAEAEYVAASAAAQEAMWLSAHLQELGYPQQPIIINCDNQSAIAIADNPVQHTRVKHIALRLSFLRECIADGHITMCWVRSADQTADILTKALGPPLFKQHSKTLLSESLVREE